MSREISRAMERSIDDLADKDYELLMVLMVKPDEKISIVIDQSGDVANYNIPDDLVEVARDMTNNCEV